MAVTDVHIRHWQGLMDEGASIVADLVARTITISGKVQGHVIGSSKVELKASATVEGDITAPNFVMDDGAALSGTLADKAMSPLRLGLPARASSRSACASQKSRVASMAARSTAWPTGSTPATEI